MIIFSLNFFWKHIIKQVSAKMKIRKSEVVSPFRDAMRFVDGIERNLDGFQKFDVFFLGQLLRRNVKKFGAAAHNVRLDLIDRRFAERGVDVVRNSVVGAGLSHRIDLIFHQGDERRNHDGYALEHEGGQLVAERFSAPSGHEHKNIVAFKQRTDDFRLLMLESVKSEVLLQSFVELDVVEHRERE